VPKGKKIKVLTHRPRYIETATVPKFGEETSFSAEVEQAAPAARSAEESTIVPKVPIVEPVEAEDEAAKKPELEKTIVLPEILSPPIEAELPKVAKAPATTPKRRRMASVLDAIIETIRALTPAPVKKVVEAAIVHTETEVGPSVPAEMKPAVTKERAEQESPDIGIAMEKEVAEEAKSPAPEVLSKNLDFIIRHASGKRLSEEEIAEAKHYARELKYPKGALVFNGTDEYDFLYCLPDNKEISVYREMTKSMGFPKLEVGLSAMSKDDLVDNLAYNSLKVQKL
jgi:ribosomal protein L14